MPVDDRQFEELRVRVATLERELRSLEAYVLTQYAGSADSPPLSESLYEDVAALKRQGKIIEAIKLYRTKTNAGLAEAKDFVDHMQV